MHHFFFNDCLPDDVEDYHLVSSLEATIREFNTLKTDLSAIIDGVVTVHPTHNIFLNNKRYSLLDCISNLDRSLKRLAFSYFTKYPIEANLSIASIDELISNDYFIRVNNIDYNAINAKIVLDNEGVLFTLALHQDLMKDNLIVFDLNNYSENILNLFGNEHNTSYINSEIIKIAAKKLSNFDRLLSIIGENKFAERFKKNFNSSSVQVQESVISHFQTAIARNGFTRLCSDERIIKDVTPVNESEIKVYELRIFSPVAYRIYFYEADKVYLAMMERKPEYKVQSAHILAAKSVIKELVMAG